MNSPMQYCRYMKCLSTGMRREAVQEERTRAGGGGGGGGGGKGGGENNDMEASSIGSRWDSVIQGDTSSW